MANIPVPYVVDLNLPNNPETRIPDTFRESTRIYNALRILQQYVSYSGYAVVLSGADTKGVQDATMAFTNAMEKMYKLGRTAIYIPEGVYLVKNFIDVVRPGIRFIGAGALKVFIKQDTSGLAVIKLAATATNFEISDVTLEYNPASVPAVGNIGIDSGAQGTRCERVTTFNTSIGFNFTSSYGYLKACNSSQYNDSGVKISGSDILVDACVFNSAALAASAGIHLTASALRVTVTNNYCTGASQAYGIQIILGALSYNIHNNTVLSNSIAGILDNGTVGATSISRVSNNLGYNPIGIALTVPGVSPWNYQAGHTAETMYVDGVCKIDVAKSGFVAVTVFAAATTATIPLGPNDIVTLTYGVLPLVAIFKH